MFVFVNVEFITYTAYVFIPATKWARRGENFYKLSHFNTKWNHDIRCESFNIYVSLCVRECDSFMLAGKNINR